MHPTAARLQTRLAADGLAIEVETEALVAAIPDARVLPVS